MSSFWERKLGNPAPAQQQPQYQPPARPQRAWWQADEPAPEPQQYQGNPNAALQHQMPGGTDRVGPGGSVHPNDTTYIQSLRKMRNAAKEMTQEQMEEIAEWELANLPKYANRCPQCDSDEYIVPGARGFSGAPAKTDHCFACGYSGTDHAPSPALGGSSDGTRTASRQIDTGGAVKSMYMRIGDGRSLPASYVPRGG
jgi:hypothetical protein